METADLARSKTGNLGTFVTVVTKVAAQHAIFGHFSTIVEKSLAFRHNRAEIIPLNILATSSRVRVHARLTLLDDCPGVPAQQSLGEAPAISSRL
jgi:hypothetical protein